MKTEQPAEMASELAGRLPVGSVVGFVHR